MNIKEENIKIFRDTLKQIANDDQLQEFVKHSKTHQNFYSGRMEFDMKPEDYPSYFGKADIVVTKNGSFNAARRYSQSKVAVLNFASATNPGGGVTKGSNAQEECLCRCSTLYECLNTDWAKEHFYEPHRRSGTPLHNDDIIFTPGVVIIKSDSYTGLYQRMHVDVITCAAPNLRETPANAYNHENGEGIKVTDEELYEIHKKRADKILNCALYHGDDTVILGAFGCGAFKNPPEVVAKAYKDIITEKYLYKFRHIEFAVYCGRDDTNYKVFSRILGDLK